MATFTGSNDAEVLPDLDFGPVQGVGNDFVDALGGDDIAIGWSGDDVIRGGAGADAIIGGLVNSAGVTTASGIDAADYTTSVNGVTIDLSVTVSLTLPMQGINLQFVNASQGFGGHAQGTIRTSPTCSAPTPAAILSAAIRAPTRLTARATTTRSTAMTATTYSSAAPQTMC